MKRERLNLKDILVKDILKITNGKLLCGDENIVCENFSKDTRTIQENDIYVGIKGENFDGSTLYKEAFEKGALVCILQGENFEIIEGKTIIIVEDTIKAIQQIAKYKRKMYNIPIVAVTGSVGKTSTKDIIASVMSKKYKVLKTEGNMNNHIGLPMTILKLKDHTAMVVEMGMNHFGEISVLTNIVEPNIAVITNIGTAHIGILGSRENILKAKIEILEGMNQEGKLVLNNDNDLLHNWIEEHKDKYNIVSFGIENNSKLVARNCKDLIGKDLIDCAQIFEVDIDNQIYNIEVPVAGQHFIYNSLAAIAVGLETGIGIDKIQEGIKEFKLTKNRMEIVKSYNNATIINDSYNASLDSMKASLGVLANMSAKRKIAVLGDMFELGNYEEKIHREVGEEVIKQKIDVLITIGNLSKYIAEEAEKQGMKKEDIYTFDDLETGTRFIKEFIKPEDVILLKASNGMKFSKIVENLKN